MFKAFSFYFVLLLTITGSYMYLAYQDFTCHGCMSVPSFKNAFKENSLIAIYRGDGNNTKDTLFLSQGRVHGGGYLYYTKSYFVGYTGKLPLEANKMYSKGYLAGVTNGEISGYRGMKEIPKNIQCMDSLETVLENFELIKIFPYNISSGPKKNYLKEWKIILSRY